MTITFTLPDTLITSRFVTGLTDIQQIKKRKTSMYDVGRRINLPKSFVDIRHQITHDEEMPSLLVLRDSTKRALSWLYQDYWRDLCDTFFIDSGKPAWEDEYRGDVKQRLETVLHTHHSKCLEALANEKPDRAAQLNKNASDTASHIITRNCRGEIQFLRIVVNACLKDGMLIPSKNM